MIEGQRPRRALSQTRGDVSLRGPRELAEPLARAILAPHQEGPLEDADVLTHGFHAWPGRMHRGVAGSLLDILVPRPNAFVLDPFAGGGTVAIEALVRGHRVATIDANPLSAMLIRVKTRITRKDDREAFRFLVDHLVQRSLERVQSRTLAKAQLHGEHLIMYGPHTLKELAGLLEEIRALDQLDIDPQDKEAALALFSSIVVKLSNKLADTSAESVRKRIRKGLATELFGRKATELIARWASLADAASRSEQRMKPVETYLGDARHIRSLQRRSPIAADLILTSPPYGGTYDYVDHHALRLDWLGLEQRSFEQAEIGSRRHTTTTEQWDRELGDTLVSLRGSLAGEASRIALVIGDAQIGPRRVDAHDHVLGLAPHVGLEPVAAASIERDDYLGGSHRKEHIIVLRPI